MRNTSFVNMAGCGAGQQAAWSTVTTIGPHSVKGALRCFASEEEGPKRGRPCEKDSNERSDVARAYGHVPIREVAALMLKVIGQRYVLPAPPLGNRPRSIGQIKAERRRSGGTVKRAPTSPNT
jgi:hypothetical protein